MVVINEIFDVWETAKRSQDYHLYFREWWQKDVESWVKRDRNHPSVRVWSIGNEIGEDFDTSGLRIARNLKGNSAGLIRHDGGHSSALSISHG